MLVYELPSVKAGIGCYRFIIKDQGSGIRQEQLEHIFKPFHYYLSNKNQNESSGLGLAITKALVDTLGGNVNIVSHLGEGTAVTIDLQLELANLHEGNRASLEEVSERVARQLKVLFVEDNPLQILVARRLLEKKGANVLLASNAQETIEVLHGDIDDSYTCVILDLQIQTNIMDLLRHIRQKVACPIVGISSPLSAEEKHGLVESGLCEFFAKPVKFVELYDYLERLNH